LPTSSVRALTRATGRDDRFRVENGRLAEATAVIEDNLARMRQLGFEL
jgi:hypothetical protein